MKIHDRRIEERKPGSTRGFTGSTPLSHLSRKVFRFGDRCGQKHAVEERQWEETLKLEAQFVLRALGRLVLCR